MENKDTNAKLGQLVGKIVEQILQSKKGEANQINQDEKDKSASNAISNIFSSIPIMTQLMGVGTDNMSDAVRSQLESIMKKYEEDNEERVEREKTMIGLLTSIDKKMDIVNRSTHILDHTLAPERVGEKQTSSLADKIENYTKDAPTAIKTAGSILTPILKVMEKTGSTAATVEKTSSAAAPVAMEGAGLGAGDMANIAGAGAGMLKYGSKIPAMGGMMEGFGKIFTSAVGGITVSLVLTVIDGILGMLKSDKWGASKLGSFLGGAFAGSFDNKIVNTLANAGKWAGIGAAIGSTVPLVGTLLGGIVGGIIGAILGWVGGAKVSKAMDDIGSKLWKNIQDAFNVLVDKTKEFFSAENVGKMLATSFDFIVGAIRTGFKVISDTLPPILDSLKNAMVSALHAVVDIFAKVGDMLQTALKNLWDMIKDPKKMYENVKNVVSGGWDSLVSGSKAVKDYSTGVAESFMQHSKEAQKIQNGQSVLSDEAPKPTAVPVVAPPATKEPKRVPGELSPQVNEIDKITKYAGNLVAQTQPTKSSKSTLKKVTSLDEIAKAAVNVEKQTGYPAAAIVTQWALESGWGQSVSGDYNHFGMTRDAGTSKKYHTVETPEDITYEQLMHYPKKERMTATNVDGTPITGPWQGKKIIIMRRDFSSYDSLEDAIKDNVRLITSNKRYAGGLEAYKKSGNVEDLLRGIARGGYATGRNYESQLVSISKQSNIAQAISKAKSDGLSADTYVAALVPGAKATSRGEQMSKGIADISPRPVNPVTPQQPPVMIAQTNNAQSASLQLPPGARPVSSNRRMEEGRFSRS